MRTLTLIALAAALTGCVLPVADLALRSIDPEWGLPPAPDGSTVADRSEGPSTVYSADECIGPVIMGRCHGSILPKRAYHPTCYGTWLNGECTGPMF